MPSPCFNASSTCFCYQPTAHSLATLHEPWIFFLIVGGLYSVALEEHFRSQLKLLLVLLLILILLLIILCSLLLLLLLLLLLKPPEPERDSSENGINPILPVFFAEVWGALGSSLSSSIEPRNDPL